MALNLLPSSPGLLKQPFHAINREILIDQNPICKSLPYPIKGKGDGRGMGYKYTFKGERLVKQYANLSQKEIL